jgi:Secretion system C-terminal sorting domain/Bacterial Ig domain/Right handed beta helix region
MKKLLNLLLLSFALNANATDYYLSPTGSDANPGTFALPKFTLNSVWLVMANNTGHNIYMRGGTYSYTTQQYLKYKNGAAGNLVKIQPYQNEVVIITKGAGYTHPFEVRGGCYLKGDYIHFLRIRITGFTQETTDVWSGLWADSVNHCIFERMEVDNNGGGLYIQNGSTDNLVLNSDFHDNYDPITNGSNGDGLDVAYITAGSSNTVRGCRAWDNSDDGFDCYENQGYVLFDKCWSWHNGYTPGTNMPIGNGEGFKLGTSGGQTGLLRKLTKCIAFNNLLSGFHQEEAVCRMEVYNNTSYNNGQHGFLFDYQNKAHIFKNNIAFNNTNNNAFTSALTELAANSFGGSGPAEPGWDENVTSGDFVSLDASQTLNARQADGSLPVITFLNLLTGSDLKDAGVDVGLPFVGSAPDRGAFEFGATGNQSPTANAGADQTITLPTSSVTLSGSGTDADGTIASYTWTRISGPNTPTIVSPSSASTNVTGLIAGTYVFRLTVTDNLGATGFDDITVIVNTPPTANAGADQTITLPTSSVTLSGSGSDPDGTIASYAWTRISGPNTPTIVSPSSASTNVTGLIAGTYVFRLTVTDNRGATGFDEVTVTVNATSVPLTVSITSPANNAILSGTTNISANAADDVPIDRVEFYYDYTTTNTSPALFTDNFTRANSTTIGSGWVERYTAADYQIVSNKIKLTSNDGKITAAYRLNGLVSPDYSVQATLNFSNLNLLFAGVGGRMINSTYPTFEINGYMAFAEPNSQSVYIFKRIDGLWTQLGVYATPILINTNYVLKLSMSGTNLKAYWNGALVISVTDATYTATGYTGVVTGTNYSSIAVTWDDFTLTSPTLFTDNFNRANSNTIGASWTERYTAANYQIVSNKIKLTSNDGSVTTAYTTSGLVFPNYSVQATLNFSGLSSIFAGVGGRMTNYITGDFNGYTAFAEPSAQRVYIFKRINEVWTELGSYATPIAINTNYILKLAMNGTSLKAYWNGALVISVTDATYTATGYTGVATGNGYNPTTVTWDDFATEPISTNSNTTLIGSDLTSPHSVSWNTLGLPNGNYKLTAKVFNTNAENAVSAPVNVTVSNTAARANAVFTQTEDVPAILNKSDFVLYPNPAGNELNVILKSNSSTSFTITDVLGRTIKTITVKANTGPVKLDLTGIPAGTYFITGINKEGLAKTNKFIKQ